MFKYPGLTQATNSESAGKESGIWTFDKKKLQVIFIIKGI